MPTDMDPFYPNLRSGDLHFLPITWWKT